MCWGWLSGWMAGGLGVGRGRRNRLRSSATRNYPLGIVIEKGVRGRGAPDRIYRCDISGCARNGPFRCRFGRHRLIRPIKGFRPAEQLRLLEPNDSLTSPPPYPPTPPEPAAPRFRRASVFGNPKVKRPGPPYAVGFLAKSDSRRNFLSSAIWCA